VAKAEALEAERRSNDRLIAAAFAVVFGLASFNLYETYTLNSRQSADEARQEKDGKQLDRIESDVKEIRNWVYSKGTP